MRREEIYHLHFLKRLDYGFPSQGTLDFESRKAQVQILEFREETNIAVVQLTFEVELGEHLNAEKVRLLKQSRNSGFQKMESISRILTFIFDSPIDVLPKGAEFKPETPEEERLLDEMPPYDLFEGGLSVRLSSRSFVLQSTSGDQLGKFIDREVGLALYADALRLQQPTAMFREFWRVLESAFGAKGGELTQLLSEFEPAQQMEFTPEELEELRVLRGRASHAESRGGLEEFRRVNREVEEHLSRMKNLVEQVILSKKVWGTRGTGVDRLGPLQCCVMPGGGLAVFSAKQASSNSGDVREGAPAAQSRSRQT